MSLKYFGYTNSKPGVFPTMRLRDYRVTQHHQRRLNKQLKTFLVFCTTKCVQMSGWELLGTDPSGGSHHWRSVCPQQKLVPMGSIHFHLTPSPHHRLLLLQELHGDLLSPKEGLHIQPWEWWEGWKQESSDGSATDIIHRPACLSVVQNWTGFLVNTSKPGLYMFRTAATLQWQWKG